MSVVPQPARHLRLRLVSYLLTGLAGAALITACDSPDDGNGQPPPPQVSVLQVTAENIDVEREYAGRARGARMVEVRARVDGILEHRRYVEGQRVEQDDVLFDIDSQPFDIARQRAEAERQDARAGLNQAEREWRRIRRLFEQNAVSERERDQAQSQHELAQARLALTEAGVADAERNLGYAQVRAPLAGATGLEMLPEGSLVERGTLLTTVTELDPVHVRFSVPERDAALRRAAGGSRGSSKAFLTLPDGRDYDSDGEVTFTDSTIDARTGSVMARAVFANPDGDIIPGQFVRVRVVLQSLEDVMLVPESAVGQGREGPQVFVVSDDKASARVVQLGPVVDGRQIILDGLEEGDQVVVNGQVALRDGMPVRAEQAEDAQQDGGA